MANLLYLDVPFAEKDQARALGARWDGAARSWYAPAGVDHGRFARWAASSPIGKPRIVDAVGAPQVGVPKGIALSELLSGVQSAVRSRFPAPIWVRAEIADSRPRGRDGLLFELIDPDQRAAPFPAKASALVWGPDRSRLLQSFSAATGQEPSAGMRVLLLVEVSHHFCFGLELRIRDIDPSFTVGAHQAKVNQIWHRLRQERIFERNHAFRPPYDYTRVAVVAPRHSAGLGDFKAQADTLASAGLCEFDYYPATFEGTQACVQIVSAFEEAWRVHRRSPYDALVLIRGGGAQAGLMALEEYDIARALCLSPFPVLTGLGHQRDRTLLDEVACRAFDTPSKVIANIEQAIAQAASRTSRDWTIIIAKTVEARRRRQAVLDHMRSLVVAGAETALVRSRNSAQLCNERVLRAIGESLLGARRALDRDERQIRIGALEAVHGAADTLSNSRHQVLGKAESLLQRATSTMDLYRERIVRVGHGTVASARVQLRGFRNSVHAGSRPLVQRNRRRLVELRRGLATASRVASSCRAQLGPRSLTLDLSPGFILSAVGQTTEALRIGVLANRDGALLAN